MTPRVHVVGAGLAGLSCAVLCAHAGAEVVLYEAAAEAGGRTRSFHDPILDRRIDNGTHLLLGANQGVLGYLKLTGGIRHVAAAPPRFTLYDARTRHSRVVAPWRPGIGLREACLALGFPKDHVTVAEHLRNCPSYEQVFAPLCLAVLNTPPEQASAAALAKVMRTILLGGKSAMTPYLFPAGLSAALVDPALDFLKSHGGEIRFGHRLIGFSQRELTFKNTCLPVSYGETTILALPSSAIARLYPEIGCFEYETIINIHYRLSAHLPDAVFFGLSRANAHWVFVRNDVASVTISAASPLRGRNSDELAALCWQEIAGFLNQDPTFLPPHRMVREARATLRQTPAAMKSRPDAKTAVPGVILAGDWLAGHWPCTMESAVLSGMKAAQAALKRDDLRFP